MTATLESTNGLQRRFSGVGRAYGAEALERFRAAHVCVVGIGGVGSWVAEALARSAIGRLTLVDLDMVAESNVNRQLHALSGEFGKAKVTAMAERIDAINPGGTVDAVEDFVTTGNIDELLAGQYDYLVDAIDHAHTKAAIIAWGGRRNISVLTAGAAGGKIDPTRIQVDDLSRTIQDPLLSRVRASLRKEYGYPRDPKKKFGVPAVFSSEPVRTPLVGASCDEPSRTSGLNCSGYGSSVCVTATFGLFAAGHVLKTLANPTWHG